MLAAGIVGVLLGALHAVICNLPRVNSVAVGIAMMVFGIGLAFYLGKPLHPARGPEAAGDRLRLLVCPSSRCEFALRINALFLVGVAAGAVPGVDAASTRAGA